MIARKIAYNVVTSSILKLISIGISIFSISMLEKYLGVIGFGEYTTVFQYFALFTAISDLGLYPEMTRKISKKDEEDEERIVNKIFTLRITISLIVFFVSLIFIWFLPYSLNIRLGILIMGISFLFSSSYGLLNGVFQKRLAMNKVVLAELVGKFFQAIVIIIAVKFDKGFLFAVSYMFLSMLINFLIIYIMTQKIIKIKLDFDFNYWKIFLKKSLPLGIGAIATFCYFKADSIILGLYQDQEQVGLYGAAYKIIETLVFFPAMVVGLVFPLFSRYHLTEQDKFNKIANLTLKFFIIIVVPMVISIQFLADKIVVFIGKEAFLQSGAVLRILIFSLNFMFFGQLFTNLLIATHKQKELMKILIIGAIFNSLSNFLILESYQFFNFVKIPPYFPVATVSVLTEMLVASISLYILIKNKIYQIQFPKLSLIFLAGFLMFSVYYFSEKFLPFSNLVLSITISLAVLIYFAIIFAFKVVSKKEMHQLLMKDSQIVTTEN